MGRGTEAQFSGDYCNFKEDGTFLCKRCNAVLYKSVNKFEFRCGWPSFDDAVEGAVEKRPDPDGRRTEIVGSKCEGHLGHVFSGEGFTPNNVRHCVNSLSISFQEKMDDQ